MALGNSDNHAKNHALLYTSSKPELAPAYDIDPVLLDHDVTHEMAFRVGEARMADEVVADDLDAFARALGARGFAMPRQRRTTVLLEALLVEADVSPGPAGRGLRYAIRRQIHHLSSNLDLGIDVPEFDNVPVDGPVTSGAVRAPEARGKSGKRAGSGRRNPDPRSDFAGGTPEIY